MQKYRLRSSQAVKFNCFSSPLPSSLRFIEENLNVGVDARIAATTFWRSQDAWPTVVSALENIQSGCRPWNITSKILPLRIEDLFILAEWRAQAHTT